MSKDDRENTNENKSRGDRMINNNGENKKEVGKLWREQKKTEVRTEQARTIYVELDEQGEEGEHDEQKKKSALHMI